MKLSRKRGFILENEDKKKIPAGKKGGKPTGIRRGNLIDH